MVEDEGVRLIKDEAQDSKRERRDREKVQKGILESWGLDSYVEMAKKPRHLQIFTNEPNERWPISIFSHQIILFT